MTGRFAAVAVVAVGLGIGAVVAPAVALADEDDVAEAQEAVFGRQHLDNIAAPTTLRYTFRRSGSLMPDVVDGAELAVTAIGADGRKRVALRLFSGPNERRIEPAQGYRNNPVIVAFLQRDVEQMGRLTGGSPQYFRNRIREAFGDGGAVQAEPVTIAVEGSRVEATRVTVEPFARDPNLPRFAEFRHKRFEFVLAPAVPGGVYSLRAVTPNGTAGGEPLLDESVTYSGRE